MKRIAIAFVSIIVAVSSAPTTLARSSQPRQLTFEDRVRAQEAIERVYYSHQIGVTKPFEEAVARESIENKVRKYLKESVALEQLWRTPITSRALQAELERIIQNTRLPERLKELFHALNDDEFLIQETLARSALADRLARQLFDVDDHIHAAARQEAEELRSGLASGELDPRAEHPRRTIHTVSLSVETTTLSFPPSENVQSGDAQLGQHDFDALLESLTSQGSEPFPIDNRPEGYEIRVLLEDEPTRIQFADFIVPRRGWDEWWAETEQTLEESTILSVASTDPLLSHGLTAGNSSATGCVKDDTWQPTQLNLPPAGRNGHTAVWTGSVMIVWGGYGRPNPRLPSGGKYDPLTSVWTPTSLIGAPGGRIAHTAIWTGNEMVIWGGVESSTVNTGGRYDPVNDTWKPTSIQNAPNPRQEHTAVWTGTEMIIWGGFPESNKGGRYNPSSDTWIPTSTINAPAPRRFHAAVWTGSQMVIWGGSSSGFQIYDPGGRYDPVGDRWLPISTVNEPIRRQLFVCIWDGRTMFVWGGWSASLQVLETGARYDPIADTWSPTSSIGAPSNKNGARSVWTGQEILVWGGCTSVFAPCLTNTGGRYDPGTDTWRPMTTTNAPSPRSGHSAVWTGTEMIVYGGEGYTAVNLDDGYRYDPVADAWKPTFVSRSPQARSGHAAIWTGNVMIIWGGGDGFGGELIPGYKYDPLIDWWSPIATAGAPQIRSEMTAVWSGSEMIVWGGIGAGQPLATGGRYNPSSDSWSMVSNINAPSPRWSHTAIWTGNRMVIWGGTGSGLLAEFATGGRYDPVTDTWSSTSLVSAPLKRYSHTAIWSGTEMIVWGGTNGASPATYSLNTGGRYNPATDQWSSTSVFSAPAGRSGHSAVWAGAEMVIWGGSGNSGLLVTGARFSPVTNTWAPITSSPPSGPRYEGTTIWTGQYMILWGGLDSAFQYQPTGLRYDPAADTWSTVSSVGAPSPRLKHSAVWTGHTMTVWGGGEISSTVLLTGGQYGVDQSPDNDRDGFSVCAGDCDDQDPSIHPAATEACDGEDNDCDGIADNGDPGGGVECGSDIGACQSGVTSCKDGALVCAGGVGPTVEICDGLDNNCEGDTDEGLGSSTCGVGACTITVDNCVGGVPQVCLPGTPKSETCNGLDDDCDGATDEGLGPGTVDVDLDQVTLWPPNHRMVDLHASVTVSGGCLGACQVPPAIVISSVTSNEQDDANGIGDGQTVDDIQGVTPGSADFDFSLRAERGGAGDGRLYQVTYQVTDCFGDTTVGYGGVFVPHDEAGVIEPLLLHVVAPGDATASYALEWNPIAGATQYNILRGRVSSLHAVGLFAVIDDANCVALGLTTTSLSGGSLDEEPPAGEAFFYLAEYVKGTRSGYGTEAGSRELIIDTGDSCN